MTTYWAPLLHIYQPPTQEIQILKLVNKDCYKPLFSIIDDYENAKFCLNINGVLIELLYEYGLADTMELIKKLVAEDKIEIMGTAKFHPILPLIPEKEVKHQIKMNEVINRREFGDFWKPMGFFPPEMAVSPDVIKIIQELGYKWIILSGIACPVDWPYNQIYASENGLQLLFRDDILSNKISFKNIKAKEFVKNVKHLFLPEKNSKADKDINSNKYLITAMDGETFGHHIKLYEKTFLAKVLELLSNDTEKGKGDNVEIVFISELDKYFPRSKKNINPRESSWSTNYDDIVSKVPYPLWKHPANNIHKYYWKIMKSLNQLMNIAEKLDFTENWDVQNYYNTARYLYDRGIYSCPTWWSNPQHGMWSPNLIYKGVELLLKSALNAQMALVHAGDDSGEGYFDSISYYHGLLLMELYSITKSNLKNKKN